MTVAETLAARACDSAVAAIRAAVPGMPVGLSISETIDPDPFARAAAIRAWRRPTRLRLGERLRARLGRNRSCGNARRHRREGRACDTSRRGRVRAQPIRAPSPARACQVDGGVEEARATARLIPDGLPQLWHGYGERTWEMVSAAAAEGVDIRIGLEDTFVLADGRVAIDNAQLFAAAAQLIGCRE